MARQGAYLPALESLFDPPSIDLLQLSLAQYRSWAAAVWQVLETWAVRAGEVGAREMITTYRGSAPTVEMDLDEDDEDEGGLKRGTHASVERRLKKAQNFKVGRALALLCSLADRAYADRPALYIAGGSSSVVRAAACTRRHRDSSGALPLRPL